MPVWTVILNQMNNSSVPKSAKRSIISQKPAAQLFSKAQNQKPLPRVWLNRFYIVSIWIPTSAINDDCFISKYIGMAFSKQYVPVYASRNCDSAGSILGKYRLRPAGYTGTHSAAQIFTQKTVSFIARMSSAWTTKIIQDNPAGSDSQADLTGKNHS